MSTEGDDRDLREAFAKLRGEERARATPFAALLRAARERRIQEPRAAFAPILVGVAMLAASVFIAHHLFRSAPPPPGVEIALANWVEPTAFLLKTPGQELLQTVPAFGGEPTLIAPHAPASPAQPPRT
jgi:hypothetical protein